MIVAIYATSSKNLIEEYPILSRYKEYYYPDDDEWWAWQDCIIKDMNNEELFKVIQELTSFSKLIIGYADEFEHKQYGIDFKIEIYNDYRE